MMQPQRTLRLCVWGALACLAAAPASADSAQMLFARGNEALTRGDAQAAVTQYRALTDSGSRDPDLEYNLAVAEARLGELGRALWHLSRAHEMRPSDTEVLEATRKVQEALGKRQAARDGEATVQTRPPLYEALTGWLSVNALAVLLWLAVALTSIAWIVLQRDLREGRRLAAGITLAMGSLVACLAGSALAVRSGVLREGPRAIVLDDEVALRAGPDTHAPRVRSLAEGTRATLLEELGEQTRVRVGEDTGWVPGKTLGPY